jgi:hypothetical protein
VSMVDLLETYSTTFLVTDADGVAANPSSSSCSLTLPDGTTVAPSLTNPTTGTLRLDYVTAQEGRHSGTVTASVGSTVRVQAFEFDAVQSRAIVSLADARAHLNMSATTNDEELRRFVEAATDFIEGKIGPVVRRTITNKPVIPGADGRLYLNGPAVSLTTITAAYGSGGTYTVGDYYLDTGTGVVHPPYYGQTFTLPVLVTYVAGRVIVPPAIRQAALDYIKWRWESQRGATALPLPGGEFAIPAPADVPYKITSALEPYRMPGIG